MTHTTIDGQSIYSTFGAMLSPDSIGNLLKYPTREAVRQTDFAESHGIQAYLNQFRVQRRRIPLTFFLMAGSEAELQARIKAFTDALTAPGWHTFEFGLRGINRLRYVSAPSLIVHRPFSADTTGATLSVTMEEEFFPVLARTSYMNVIDPTPIPHTPSGVASIRDVDLSQYGASLDAAYAGAVAAPADTKEPFNDGRKLYLDEPRRKAVDWTLCIDLAAPTLTDFMNNWGALYNTMASFGTFPLYLHERGAASEVFYRDCTACTAFFGTWYAAKMQIKLTCPAGE